MKYYKIIKDNQIIGVSTSNDCLAFQAKHQMLEHVTDELAEYVECMSRLFHGQQMQPIKTNVYRYEIADIVSIGEQEYNILVPAVETAPVPVEEEEEEQVIIPPTNEADELTVEYVRASKLNQMSMTCHNVIEAGFDLELRGETKHFSLDTQDQLNLISLSAMAQSQSLIPYHADGEECVFYTSEEIGQIVETATAFKIYHTTYYNALKGYINALETIEEIAAIEYGTPIPEEYKSDVLRALEQ